MAIARLVSPQRAHALFAAWEDGAPAAADVPELVRASVRDGFGLGPLVGLLYLDLANAAAPDEVRAAVRAIPPAQRAELLRAARDDIRTPETVDLLALYGGSEALLARCAAILVP